MEKPKMHATATFVKDLLFSLRNVDPELPVYVQTSDGFQELLEVTEIVQILPKNSTDKSYIVLYVN